MKNFLTNPSPHPEVDPEAVSMAVQSTNPNSWPKDESVQQAPDIPPVTPDMNPYFYDNPGYSSPSIVGPSEEEALMGMGGMGMPGEMGPSAGETDEDAIAEALMGRMREQDSMSEAYQNQVMGENEEAMDKKKRGM